MNDVVTRDWETECKRLSIMLEETTRQRDAAISDVDAISKKAIKEEKEYCEAIQQLNDKLAAAETSIKYWKGKVEAFELALGKR